MPDCFAAACLTVLCRCAAVPLCRCAAVALWRCDAVTLRRCDAAPLWRCAALMRETPGHRNAHVDWIVAGPVFVCCVCARQGFAVFMAFMLVIC